MLRPIKPYIDYALDYNYISTVLCINKDKPEVECNGKCHLIKEVKQQQKKDVKILPIQIKDYPIGFVELTSIPIFHSFCTEPKSNFLYLKNYIFSVSDDVFRPPKFLI